MRSQLILLACCLLMACSDSTPVLLAQTLPVDPPANSEMKCDAPIAQFPAKADAGMLRGAYLNLLDLYDVCSLRHNALVDWLVQHGAMMKSQRLLETKDRA